MSEIIRAIQTEIPFKNASVDAYKLENYRFEKRFGLTGISTALGYSKEWFGRLPKQGVKQLKAMYSDGFTGCQIEVQVPRFDGKSGSSIAKTLSVRDFNKVLAYEALKKRNVKAIIILISLSEKGLENLVNDAFSGVSLNWFVEKIVHYSQWTYEEMEEALQYNREEVKALYGWGYDPDELDEDAWDLDLRLPSLES
jgi:hypothetical protein